jgi:hypothetical protein
MKNSISILLLLIASLVSSHNLIADEKDKTEGNEKILFVGNSFSYFNDGIHNHFSNLVRSAGLWKKGKSRSRLKTISGGKLYEHISGLNQILKEQQWDKVVLQPYSNGPISKDHKANFQKASEVLSKMIRKSGAEPVLFMSWAYKDKPLMMDKLKKAFVQQAKILKADVVPVGLAFKALTKQHPEIELYTRDVARFDKNDNVIYRKTIKHPSLAGTYLAACVFYSSIFNLSAEGLAYTANLPKSDVLAIQKIAWATVQSFNAEM